MVYKEDSRGILKHGHTMFAADIVKELNRKDYLEKRVRHLEMALMANTAKVKPYKELKESLLAYDDWSCHEEALEVFLDEYADQEVDIFAQHGDYFILEDNNVVMPKDSFDFI